MRIDDCRARRTAFDTGGGAGRARVRAPAARAQGAWERGVLPPVKTGHAASRAPVPAGRAALFACGQPRRRSTSREEDTCK